MKHARGKERGGRATGTIPASSTSAPPSSRQPSSKKTSSATHFETSKWPSVLLALGSVLCASPIDYFLPEQLQVVGGPVRGPVVLGIYLAIELYFELSRSEFTKYGLIHLERELIPKAMTAVYRIYRIRQLINQVTGEFAGIKLHLLLHMPMFIRLYGAPKNWDTSSFESAHKSFVKEMYRSSAKRTTTLHLDIMRTVRSSWPNVRIGSFTIYAGSTCFGPHYAASKD